MNQKSDINPKGVEKISPGKMIEICAGFLLVFGVWMPAFVNVKMTLTWRLVQMAIMIVSVGICCGYEWMAYRKKRAKEKPVRNDRLSDQIPKWVIVVYFGVMAVIGVALIYTIAFERNRAIMALEILLVAYLIPFAIVHKKDQP